MGVIQRGIIFIVGTISNGILFLFHSRVILEILSVAEQLAGSGPATSALNLLPAAIQLAIGGLQIGLVVYLLVGLGEERTANRRPMR